MEDILLEKNTWTVRGTRTLLCMQRAFLQLDPHAFVDLPLRSFSPTARQFASWPHKIPTSLLWAGNLTGFVLYSNLVRTTLVHGATPCLLHVSLGPLSRIHSTLDLRQRLVLMLSTHPLRFLLPRLVPRTVPSARVQRARRTVMF